MKKKVEILAPAGSYESLVAAINAGADAVYMGGSKFGARAYADNPEKEQWLEAIDYAHLHGAKLYMTVNTLVKEEELDSLSEYLEPYYCRGLDAVIVQDMGVFAFIRKEFPDLSIHASTQMTVTGYRGAAMLKKLGADRVVTARELSLQEIFKIREQVDIEIESFVHGALCYCYSGQCLFSSLIGGRSGNRGRCAQPCRLPYDIRDQGRIVNGKQERYVMSLKDLCTLDLLPDLIEAGVYSLKIEGRMKSPRYTAGVVSIYRKYADQYLKYGREGYKVDGQDKKTLLDLFDRGGFTEGYYQKHNGRNMVALAEKPAFREGNQELFDYLDKTYVNRVKREPLKGRLEFLEGVPVRFSVQTSISGQSAKGQESVVSAVVEGELVQTAKNQPMSAERLKKQMEKTGNTPFYFETLEIVTEGNGFLPVQSLNELRRAALAAVMEKLLTPFQRFQKTGVLQEKNSGKQAQEVSGNHIEIHVSLEMPDGLETVLALPDIHVISIDAAGFPAAVWRETVDQCHRANKNCRLVMPHIFREEAEHYFEKHKQELKAAGFDGFLVRSMEEILFLKEQNLDQNLVYDAGLYTMNHLAKEQWKELGAACVTAPLELNARELKALDIRGMELIGYGHLPMMVSAQCFRKTVSKCSHLPGLLWMKDRTGKEFPVKNHCCFCYNTVYNTAPLSFLGQEKLVAALAPAALRLQFTIEQPSEIKQISNAFISHFLYGGTEEPPFDMFTRGHLNRGVE